jgi:branched-chain amino acid transport system substrate-binding protein
VRPRSSSVSGAAPTRRRLLAAIVVPLAFAGCSDDEALEGEGPVTVYVSLPLRGASGDDGQDAADGARLALTEAGDEAGGRDVRAVFLDDTEGVGTDARWTPEQAAANARQATQDSTTIAYIGDFESGATRSSLPITNEARLLHVSPASSAVDLVAPFPGSDDVPDVQASGDRTFGRVIPSDEAQGRAGAAWANEIGQRRVGIRSDGSEFGQTLEEAFTDAGESLGLVATQSGGGELTYLAGEAKSRAGLEMGSDVFLSGGGPPRPQLMTSAAIDRSQLPPVGQDFVESFEAEYGREPGRYAAYGYEAMAVVLNSIGRAGDGGTDREAVIEAFLETDDRDSVLGTYSIDAVGDTTLDRLTGYRVEGRRERPTTELTVP